MVKYIQDYYKILGIDVDATEDEIKKAYKKSVLKYHPDVNKTKSAVKKFSLVQDAYVVLSDENKRDKYDRLRHIAKNNNQLMKRNSELANTKRQGKSNSLNTISQGVDLAKNLENEVGLFSNLLNVVTGSKVNKYNNSKSFSTKAFSKHMGHRHRKRGGF